MRSRISPPATLSCEFCFCFFDSSRTGSGSATVMPFRLEINVCNDPFPHGSPTTLEEGRYGSATFESAGECNAAAKQALYEWLSAKCSEWTEDGVTSGTFEGDDSGIEMYTYSETAIMRGRSEQINLIAQIYGVKA